MFVAATRTELHCTAEMLPATFKLCAAISYQHLRNVTGERPVLWVLLSARLLSALFLGWGTEAVCCSGGAAAPGWAVAPQLLSGRCVLPVCCSEQSLSSTDPSRPPVSQWEEASLTGTSAAGLGTSKQARLFQPDTAPLCCALCSQGCADRLQWPSARSSASCRAAAQGPARGSARSAGEAPCSVSAASRDLPPPGQCWGGDLLVVLC